MTNSDSAILAYYQMIKEDQVNAGKWIRLLYEIIITGLQEKRWFYDHKKASNALRFIERYCHHNKGPLAPQRIQLSIWEKANLSLIYGIVDAKGRRQFTEILWIVGRKMGKTLIAGGVLTYEAYVDGEFGSEIYVLAPKLDQADLCFGAFEFNVNAEKDLAKRTKSTKTRGLYIKESNTSVKKLPFSDRKSDGYNPMLFVADEISSWPAERGLKQWEVMVSGTGARTEPLGIAISSAGYVNDGIYDELMKRGTAFLMGNSREEHLLPIMYMIDDPEKWDDINELRKSMPGLGESVSVDFILKEIATAHESLSKRTEFLTKYCNIKQNSSMAWIDTGTIRRSYNIGSSREELIERYSAPGMEWQREMVLARRIDENGNHFSLEDFSRCYAVAGVDLSQTVDLTACSVVIQRGGIAYYFVKFFLPACKLEEATQRDGIPYQKYIEKGWLKLSGENFINFDDCFEWLTELKDKYSIYILQIGLDRYCAQFLQQKLERKGYHCDTVFQGHNLTGIINTTEGMMRDGTLQSADGNDLMKLHWMDSALKLSTERNLKQLVKINSKVHIDGVAATLDAMCMRANVWDKYGRKLMNLPREAS